VAIEGEILGVGHGKTGTFGGRQEDGKGRKVFWRKAREFWGERGISVEELRAWWLVLLIFFRCVRN
jgi:hypothetical protein